MGCDIHCFKEKQVNGVWVTADEWTPYDYGDDENGVEVKWENRFTDRNYNLFGLLSKGVRGEHEFSFEPRGVPFNASKEYAEEQQRWDGDGHSHSYLYLHELKDMQAFIKTAKITITGMKDKDELAKLQSSIDSDGETDWDLLYPYCQGTNANNYVEFAIDVPAKIIIGGSEHGLGKIISMFDGIDGDNHRIVFFFDN